MPSRLWILTGIAALGLVVTGLGLGLVAVHDDARSDPAVVTDPPEGGLQPARRAETARPPYLLRVADPVFGSVVTRISDNRGLGSTGWWLRHSHAKVQPWNSDGSLLLLGYTDPGFLIDGRSYRFTGRTLPGAPRGVWSNTDPDTFYTVTGNRLLRVTVSSGRTDVAHVFESWDELSIGRGEGSPSNDDRTLALIATRASGAAVISYDLVREQVLGTLEMSSEDAEGLEWAASSQSGEHVVLNWSDDGPGPGRGVDVHDRALRFSRDLAEVSEQGDLGYDAAGREVYVTFDPAVGKREGDQQRIIALRLEDGAKQLLLRTDWVGTHVSCRNLDRPGWCIVSDAVADAPRARTLGFDEIYALKVDGTRTVQRFAHAQLSPRMPYDWTTLAVPSRDGRRVLWTSDWRFGRTGPAYAYVASFDAPAPGRG